MTFVHSTTIALLAGAALLSSPASAAAGSNAEINAFQSTTGAKANAANEQTIENANPTTRLSLSRSAPLPPKAAPTHLQRASRGKMITEGRALLAKAEQVTADYRPAEGGPSKAELQTSMDRLKSDLDSMSEIGETESLRQQMAMDRLSKMMSTLSNLLKKATDTAQGITQNIR